MKKLALLVALLAPLPALAQTTCPALTSGPAAARDETRLRWAASSWLQDGLPIAAPVGGVITYTVYRAGAAVCTTTAVQTSLLTQPVGANSYYVTAKSAQTTPPNVETMMTNVVVRTVAPPSVTITPPSNLQIIADAIAKFFRAIFHRFA